MNPKLSALFQYDDKLRKEYMDEQVYYMMRFYEEKIKQGDTRSKNAIMMEWISTGKSKEFAHQWMIKRGIY